MAYLNAEFGMRIAEFKTHSPLPHRGKGLGSPGVP
jgi:hypothetical protein